METTPDSRAEYGVSDVLAKLLDSLEDPNRAIERIEIQRISETEYTSRTTYRGGDDYDGMMVRLGGDE